MWSMGNCTMVESAVGRFTKKDQNASTRGYFGAVVLLSEPNIICSQQAIFHREHFDSPLEGQFSDIHLLYPLIVLRSDPHSNGQQSATEVGGFLIFHRWKSSAQPSPKGRSRHSEAADLHFDLNGRAGGASLQRIN